MNMSVHCDIKSCATLERRCWDVEGAWGVEGLEGIKELSGWKLDVGVQNNGAVFR